MLELFVPVSMSVFILGLSIAVPRLFTAISELSITVLELSAIVLKLSTAMLRLSTPISTSILMLRLPAFIPPFTSTFVFPGLFPLHYLALFLPKTATPNLATKR